MYTHIYINHIVPLESISIILERALACINKTTKERTNREIGISMKIQCL